MEARLNIVRKGFELLKYGNRVMTCLKRLGALVLIIIVISCYSIACSTSADYSNNLETTRLPIDNKQLTSETAPLPVPEPANKEPTPPVTQPAPANKEPTPPVTQPAPELQLADSPPVIVDHDFLPESIFIGDKLRLSVRAKDDKGIEEVIVNIQTPGGIEEITLQKTDGSWETVYLPDKEGNYKLTVKAIDSKGQETIEELDGIIIKEDNPPKIVSYTIPPWVMLYKDFDISIESQDDRGVTEVKVKFEKRGTIIEEIALTKTSENVWETKYSFTNYGYIDYTITATDIKGQESYVTGKIETKIGIGGGGGGDDGCFSASTRVLMADGNFKAIVDIEEGELVKGFDFENDTVVINEVVNLFKTVADHYLIINGQLNVTDSHPFAIGQDLWKLASELKVGDKVLGRPDVVINNVERVAGETTVHNLTVNGTHNYFVAGNDETYLVHNKGGG